MRDRLLTAALNAVPAPLARHMMFLLRSNPAITDRWGHHVRPIHYYEPLPDFRQIATEEANRRREPVSINFAVQEQRALVSRLGAEYGSELQALQSDGFDFRNGYFDGLDAAIYYSLIRDLKPRRIIEIGSGFSTRIAARAVEHNHAGGVAAELICIEPFPQPRLTDAKLPMTLVRERVERIGLERFDELQANDVLFIDSSHVATFGGDVCREFLDILPRLKRGVWIHVHDIFFPHDYPADWVTKLRRAWNEQYLLEAFLAFNSSFAPAIALHWLWSDHRDELRKQWPAAIVDAAGPQGPASFWMTRVA
ncbi:MAG: class I SAM-dependent methyltransferase [Cyanobacteria bacterium]|nr:class I SAM-dependent methyltransferase [Cyanobacteriota bacterium]